MQQEDIDCRIVTGGQYVISDNNFILYLNKTQYIYFTGEKKETIQAEENKFVFFCPVGWDSRPDVKFRCVQKRYTTRSAAGAV